VAETGGGGADGGIDLVLTKGSERFFVQCKQWRAYRVSVNVVRELYGVMAAEGAAGGFVITSGRFTDNAADFARGRNIELIDGEKLRSMIGSLRPIAAGPHRHDVRTQAAESPSCPSCSGPMVRRESKRGANAGSPFWGCQKFPACRGTRPIA
jgi:restriction system protein